MGSGSSTSSNKDKKVHANPPNEPRQLRVVDAIHTELPGDVGIVVVPPRIPSALPPPSEYLNAMHPSNVDTQDTITAAERRYAWFVEDLDHPGEWEAYAEDTCERLDAALRAEQPTCMVVLNRRAYKVDLRNMEQTGSGSTVRPRRVKRVEVETSASVLREKRYIAVDPFIEEALEDGDMLEGDEREGDGVMLDNTNNNNNNNNNNSFSKNGGGERHDKKTLNSAVFPRLVRSVTAHPQTAFSMMFSPDGKTLLTGTKRELLHWDVATAKVITEFSIHNGVVLSAVYSPNEKHVVYGGDDYIIRMYNTSEAEMQQEFLGHTNKVYGVGYLAGDERFASISMDKNIRCWDVETKKCVRTVTCHTGSIFALETSKQTEWLAITGGDDNTLCTHDFRLDSGTSVTARFVGHRKTIWTCGLRGDEQQFASGGLDASVLVWDMRKPDEPLLRACQHARPVHFVEYLPYGKGLLSCSRDSNVKLTNIMTAEPVWRTKAHVGTVFRVRYHAGTEMLATSGGDAKVNLWEYGNKDKW
ncbi:WD40 repeat [Trypanosoma melophagium]|uniref:WD40 repeat n=1 Tax=Trypanosoma melophagium TaxID=715481 RepID=UPI00351AA195|nr:WD40 repeat [Trypanosoma melophagium]